MVRHISHRIAVMYLGSLVETAASADLFTNPQHPYSQALLSAIPMPDPRRERNKKLLTYDPAMHDYTNEPPAWREVRPQHFVLCSAAEAEAWAGLYSD